MDAKTTPPPLRVLLLFSDTGGGHRSAAEALIETWEAEHPGKVQVNLVDLFRYHTPFPFRRFGPSYPWMIKYFSKVYAASFRASDGPKRAWTLARASYPYVRPHLQRLLTDYPADVIVSVHPLFNHCVNWAMRDLGLTTPYLTVVTDLWSAHAFWFYRHATHLFVPTEENRRLAIRFGVPEGRISVPGLPVARKFTTNLAALQDRAQVRTRLGLALDGRVVLLIGGGEGMGPLGRVARAIDAALPQSNPATQMVIIAGRNTRLRNRLLAREWRHPVRIEGFVTNMPEWMAAADLLLTKAGPGTITEALLSGLPLVLFGKVPGQEDGNVHYVTSQGAGFWEPRPRRAAARVRGLLEPGNPTLDHMASQTRALVHADAAHSIAREVLAIAERTRTPQPEGSKIMG